MPWTNYTQCSNDTTATIYQELSPFNVSAEEEVTNLTILKYINFVDFPVLVYC